MRNTKLYYAFLLVVMFTCVMWNSFNTIYFKEKDTAHRNEETREISYIHNLCNYIL